MAKRVGVDKWLFGVVLLLVLFGLVTVFSASAVMAKSTFGTPYYFMLRQGMWAVSGLVALALLMQVDYRRYNNPKFVFTAVAVTMVLLIGVFAPGRISVNRIIGGVVVYLLIAVLFSLLFDIVERFTPHAFNVGSASAVPAAAPGGACFFYRSLITLSSVGFGDVAPVHPIARSLVMVEALLGQIYTTVLLARLVSLETVQRDRGPPRQ